LRKEGTLIGHFICNINDISSLSAENSKSRVTRSKKFKLDAEDAEVNSIHLSWISIEDGYKSEGYGAVLFMIGIISMIINNPNIKYLNLDDCSDNIGDFLKSLYYLLCIIMDTKLIEFMDMDIKDYSDFEDLIQQLQEKIDEAKEEEDKEIKNDLLEYLKMRKDEIKKEQDENIKANDKTINGQDFPSQETGSEFSQQS